MKCCPQETLASINLYDTEREHLLAQSYIHRLSKITCSFPGNTDYPNNHIEICINCVTVWQAYFLASSFY